MNLNKIALILKNREELFIMQNWNLKILIIFSQRLTFCLVGGLRKILLATSRVGIQTDTTPSFVNGF